MPYQVLNNISILSYLLNIPALCDFFATDQVTQLTVQEIGDGNLNLVFIVNHKIQPSRSLIVKQALPYLRCAGEDFPLAKERMHYEIHALKKFVELIPQHMPQVYHADFEMCLMVMQYLNNHIIMRKGMIEAIIYPQAADHLSTFLAESLFKTSSLYLTSLEKNQLITQFNANELRQLTENFVFTFPYMPHDTNKIRDTLQKDAQALWSNFSFKKNVLQLKDLFMNKTDALIHADFHTGSIMVNQNETYVIDPEFAYIGPFGFDIGALLANLIMSWVSHFERSQNATYQQWILLTIEEFLTKFQQKFLGLWNQHLTNSFIKEGFLSQIDLAHYQHQFMTNMLQESVGFAGCKIARRQLGIAGVADIREIPDSFAATRAEKMALAIAQEFVINYRNYQQPSDILTTLHYFAARREAQHASQSYHS